jgi:restriction system protein
MGRRPPRKHVSAQIKDKAVQVLFLSGSLFLASLVFSGSGSPFLKAAALGFRLPLGFFVLLGIGLWVLGHVLRPRESAKPISRAATADWFPNGEPAPGERVRQSTPDQTHAALQPPPGGGNRRAPSATWSVQVFQDIEWKRFETLCAELFAQAGFDARTQSHGADGGVDIVLYSRNASGPAAIVQCKHWANRLVGVKEVRELLGVMASRSIARGTFATSGGFTQEALRFAEQNRIHTLDGSGLLALIGKRTAEQQGALLAHAYQGEYWRPTCASCGSKLVKRTARNRSAGFWGCPAYPRCRFTLPMRAD